MRIFLVALTILVSAQLSYAGDIQRPTGWVNDHASVISVEYKDKITALIEELERKTSAEIFVVTVDSISPYDEVSYARMLFDSWRPGKKGKDNGLLVLLAVKERRWRIESGYGAEGILPDGLCGQIGRNHMVPYFKQGEYGKGLYSGVAALAGVIAKDANVALSVGPAEAVSKSSNTDVSFVALLILWLLFMIVPRIFYAANRRNGRGYYGGGWVGGGGFGGGFGGGGFGGGGGGCGGGGGAGGGF